MILIGTSGYAYRNWLGPFYPTGMPSEQFLPYYAQEFPLVELNIHATHPWTPSETERLLRLAGARLRFSAVIHPPPEGRGQPPGPHAVHRAQLGLEPLAHVGLLAAMVLPLGRLEDSPPARATLAACARDLSVPLLIEAHHRSWWQPNARHWLARAGVGLGAFDGPDPPAPEDPDPALADTGPVAAVRFHGRGGAPDWDAGGAARRDYLYAWDELVEWLPVLRRLEQTRRTVLVIFNNPWGARAATNARMLRRLCIGEPEPVGAPLQASHG